MAYNEPIIESLDRRKIMESYFPEFLRGNKDFRIFIKLATEELGLISDYIELFTDLANVDTTPEQFISELGQMVGYSYIDEYDPEIQREIIKRVFNKHESRGDEDSILKMATYAQNSGYLGGDIFYPGTYFKEQEAVLTFPRDTLYTWNKSKRSGFDRYPDGIVAVDGVIEILVGYLDKNVKKRVGTVKPAGIKLYFRMSIAMTGDKVVVKIPIPKCFSDLTLDFTKYISCHKISDGCYNVWSGAGTYIRRSGRIRQEFSIKPKIFMTATSISELESIKDLYYPHYDMENILMKSLAIPIQVVKQFRGLPSYSNKFMWDGRYSRSGLRMGVFEEFSPYRHQPELRNPLLTLSDLQDVKTDGSNHIRQSEFEVNIKRGNPDIHLFIKGEKLDNSSLILPSYPDKTLKEISDNSLAVPVMVSIHYEGVPRFNIDYKQSGRYSRSGKVLTIEERSYPGVPKWSVDFMLNGRLSRSGQNDSLD